MREFLLISIILSILPAKVFALKEEKVAFYSLILPGSGEYILGTKRKAYGFFASEAVFILGTIGFKIHENGLLNDAKIFASQYAKADYNREDEDYWYNVEMYMSKEAYLENLWRQARRLYPDEPSKQEEYVNSHAIKGDWQWVSKSRWFHYQDIRKSWREAGTRAKVFLTMLLINHLASFLDSYITAKLKGVSIVTRVTENGEKVGLSFKF